MATSTTFSEIPSKTLTPFISIEVGERNNYESLSTDINGLIIAKTGITTYQNKIEKILTTEEAITKYGQGSEAAEMAEYFFKNSSGRSIDCIGIATTTTDINPALALIGDQVYHLVASTLNDNANLIKARDFFEDRFKALSMLGGVYLTSVRGTIGELTTIGNAYNSKNLSLIESYSNNNLAKVIGAILGNVVDSGSQDPAVPFQFLVLNGLEPRPADKRLTQIERQTLLEAGIGTLRDGNELRIEQLVTTYKQTDNGVADTRWAILNSVLTASYIRADIVNYFTAKYGRAKNGVDGGVYGPGQLIMTPNLAKAELIAKLREYENKGFVENVDYLITKIKTEKDGNKLVFSSEVDLMDQLVVIHGKILI